MKREIKFRVWDLPTKRFNQCRGDFNLLTDLNRQLQGAYITQFTGLVDQTGTPIFEGDIIRHRKYTNQNSDYSFDETPKEVRWNTKYACYEFGTGIFSASPGYLKVVGNIYETPELLE